VSAVLFASASGCLFGAFLVAVCTALRRQATPALGAFGLVTAVVRALLQARATAVTLAAAAVVVVAIFFLEPGRRPRRRQLVDAIRAFAPARVLFGVAYIALVAAFDTGRVGVVSPVNATQSLWAFSVLLLGRADAVGPRVVAAGVCVVLGAAAIGVTR
jgi:hypothetical protein